MKKVQAKLKECAGSNAMSVESLERLSNALHTTTNKDSTGVEDAMMASGNSSSLTEEITAAKKFKGENKAPNKKSNKGKHTKSAITPQKKERKRPRFFVQF